MVERAAIDMAMESIVHVEKREIIPNDAAVFHYDELNEKFKHQFPKLIEDAPAEESVGSESYSQMGLMWSSPTTTKLPASDDIAEERSDGYLTKRGRLIHVYSQKDEQIEV